MVAQPSHDFLPDDINTVPRWSHPSKPTVGFTFSALHVCTAVTARLKKKKLFLLAKHGSRYMAVDQIMRKMPEIESTSTRCLAAHAICGPGSSFRAHTHRLGRTATTIKQREIHAYMRQPFHALARGVVPCRLVHAHGRNHARHTVDRAIWSLPHCHHWSRPTVRARPPQDACQHLRH